MRLATFEDAAKRSRIGAVTDNGQIVDLNSACAVYLAEVEKESAFCRLADALVPPNMLALFEVVALARLDLVMINLRESKEARSRQCDEDHIR